MRLDKFIANNTSFSRKESNKIIRKEKVLVNNKIIIDAAYQIDAQNDIIKINNSVISHKEFIYLVLNKPKDYKFFFQNYFIFFFYMILVAFYFMSKLTIISNQY